MFGVYVAVPERLTVDVAIVGFGGAGAVAAVEAADLGASVLVIERGSSGQEGGNTRVSAQGFLNPSNPGQLARYIMSLAAGVPLAPHRALRWAELACANAHWLQDHGISSEVLPEVQTHAEYPELDGADTIRKFRVQQPDKTNLWKELRSLVSQRPIAVRHDCRAVALKRGSRGVVTEVICRTKSRPSLIVSARRGVILSCGGYGAAPHLLAKYAPHVGPAWTAGCPHNLGDGVLMAAAVGARQSGMSGVCGPYLAFHPPGYESTVPVAPIVEDRPWNGRWAVREMHVAFVPRPSRHGRVLSETGWTYQRVPYRSRFYFDESVLQAGPLVRQRSASHAAGWCREVEGFQWSADNRREFDVGWIRKVPDTADTEVILGRLPRQPEIEGVGSADRGSAVFVLDLVRSILNTQGGPERDDICRVLSNNGTPIPGLFSAGELGSIFPRLYQGSGNLADCLVSGRLASQSALGKAKPH